jgi:hypothetical protein
VYQCFEDYHKKQSGFAEFCFRCSRWITRDTDWEAHCQDHIDNLDVPFRCDPATFRHAIACAGYCSGCFGKKWLPAALRIKQFPDQTGWQRHISQCIPEYVKSLGTKDSIPCPHLLCPTVLHSESDLWRHLGDIHSTDKPHAAKKRQHSPDKGQDNKFKSSNAARRKQPRLIAKLESAPKRRPEDPIGRKFVNISAMDFDPSPTDVIETAAVIDSSTLCCSIQGDSVWDEHDDSSSTETSLPSLSSDLFEAFPETREDCHSPWSATSETTTVEIPIDPEILHEVPPVPDLDGIEVVNLTGTMLLQTEEMQSINAIEASAHGRPPAIDPEDNQWKVEKLVNKRRIGRTVQYLVKWLGYPNSENTWEKRKDIDSDTVAAFEADLLLAQDQA